MGNTVSSLQWLPKVFARVPLWITISALIISCQSNDFEDTLEPQQANRQTPSSTACLGGDCILVRYGLAIGNCGDSDTACRVMVKRHSPEDTATRRTRLFLPSITFGDYYRAYYDGEHDQFVTSTEELVRNGLRFDLYNMADGRAKQPFERYRVMVDGAALRNELSTANAWFWNVLPETPPGGQSGTIALSGFWTSFIRPRNYVGAQTVLPSAPYYQLTLVSADLSQCIDSKFSRKGTCQIYFRWRIRRWLDNHGVSASSIPEQLTYSNCETPRVYTSPVLGYCSYDSSIKNGRGTTTYGEPILTMSQDDIDAIQNGWKLPIAITAFEHDDSFVTGDDDNKGSCTLDLDNTHLDQLQTESGYRVNCGKIRNLTFKLSVVASAEHQP